jgi:YebC/PmpR family DNA-binding regulatory protein
MAGHSKWAQIKYKKALTDAKKSQIFSKLSRLISVAAKEKGGDPEKNPKLRVAIEKARAFNMPQENILRAIKRGTGELPGTTLEEIIYEGYGPGGIAVLVEVVTDNKNRTLSELRRIFSECGGKLGESGSAKWLFTPQATEGEIVYIPKSKIQINDPDMINKIQSFFDKLDEQEDVKEIYSNAALPEE